MKMLSREASREWRFSCFKLNTLGVVEVNILVNDKICLSKSGEFTAIYAFCFEYREEIFSHSIVVVKLDLPGLQDLTSLLRRYGSSLTQIARRANETWRIYDEDINEIQAQQEQIWQGVHGILTKLSKL